jgi:drug/metabolite transporter (DMT)-like permease
MKKKLIYFFPVILMILANAAYSITAKVTPEDIDAFASVSLTYLVCIAYSFVMFFITRKGESNPPALKKTNWTAPALGVVRVMLEVSNLLMYRVGWDLSIGTLIMYVLLAIILVFVGRLFYKEKITLKRLLGIAICIVGVVLIAL